MVSGQSIDAIPSAHPVAIDGNVGGEWRGPVDPLRDEIINWIVGLVGVETIIQAKEDFFVQTGKVFHDDESYHRRMSYFLDTFIFAQILPRSAEYEPQTPFELYRETHPLLLVRSFTHSLFKVSKIHTNGLAVKDLCANEKLRIQRQSDELFDGIGKGDIFQGFIFDLDDSLILSHGLIFHPERAHKLLLKTMKEAKKLGTFDGLSYLSRCARLQLRHARLRHVDPRLVYADPRT